MRAYRVIHTISGNKSRRAHYRSRTAAGRGAKEIADDLRAQGLTVLGNQRAGYVALDPQVVAAPQLVQIVAVTLTRREAARYFKEDPWQGCSPPQAEVLEGPPPMTERPRVIIGQGVPTRRLEPERPRQVVVFW